MSDRQGSGWLTGLLLVPAAWVAAGVLSTFMGDPEQVFPWAFGALVLVGLGAVIVEAVRRPVIRRELLLGSLVSIGAVVLIWAVALVAQP